MRFRNSSPLKPAPRSIDLSGARTFPGCLLFHPKISFQAFPDLDLHPDVAEHVFVIGVVLFVLGIRAIVVATAFLVSLKVGKTLVFPHNEMPIRLFSGNVLGEISQALPFWK